MVRSIESNLTLTYQINRTYFYNQETRSKVSTIVTFIEICRSIYVLKFNSFGIEFRFLEQDEKSENL